MIRSQPTTSIFSIFLSLSVATVICILLIFVGSSEPWETLRHFFSGPFQSTYVFGNLLDDASLLMLTGLGAAIAFRAGVFNLGGEGQTYLGAIIASQVSLALTTKLGFVGIVPIILAGAAISACVSGLSGFFRWKWNIDELLSSFLLSSALLPVIDYAIAGPLRDPGGYLLSTPRIPEVFRLGRILEPSLLNPGIFLSLALVGLLSFTLYYSRFGFELRTTGKNREFSRYGGISVGTYLVAPMAISGALHGTAGTLQVIGTRYTCVQGATAGLGWNGIAVALIAENNPLAIVPAAIVFSYLGAAAEAASVNSDLSIELTAVIQGMVFLLITAKGLRLKLKRRKN